MTTLLTRTEFKMQRDDELRWWVVKRLPRRQARTCGQHIWLDQRKGVQQTGTPGGVGDRNVVLVRRTFSGEVEAISKESGYSFRRRLRTLAQR